MFCTNCGNEIDNKAYVCPKCGVLVKGNAVQQEVDEVSTGLNILSFLLPIIGAIIFIAWNHNYPVKANSAGKWALIGFVIGAIFYTFVFACSAASNMYYY